MPFNAALVLKKVKALCKHKKTNRSQEFNKLQFKINIVGFPKLTFNADEYDKEQARNFLNKLWFYVNQGKEDRLEQILKNEINKYYDNKITQNSSKYDKLFHSISLRSQGNVQKWSIQTSESAYLSRFNDIFKRAELVDIYNLLLNVINYLFVTKMDRFDINFKPKTESDDYIEMYENMFRILGQMSSSLFKIFDPQFDQIIDVELDCFDDVNGEFIIISSRHGVGGVKNIIIVRRFS